MSYHECRSRVRPAVESRRHVWASASSGADVRMPSDPVLGAVAVGSMLLILASVVTGIDVLVLFALLIALGYVRIAGTLESAEFERRKPEGLLHAPGTGARIGVSAAPWARSAYNGFAD